MKKRVLYFECKVSRSLIERNDKRYLTLHLDNEDVLTVAKQQRQDVHFIKNQKIMNPLDGDKLEVKVPFRYNRTMCKVFGSKTIHELIFGDVLEVEIEYGGVWNVGEWSGYSWKLNQLNLTTKEFSPNQ